MLAATDPSNPSIPATIGPTGGSLGYSANCGSPTASGLPDGYLGVGLDVYGNFSSKTYEGTGCTNPSNIKNQMPGQVVVRGPGNGTVGYCPVQSSAATATSAALTLTGQHQDRLDGPGRGGDQPDRLDADHGLRTVGAGR